MKLLDDDFSAFDLRTTPVHVGLGSRALRIDGFSFEPEVLAAYSQAVASDGGDGRMVVMIDEHGPSDHWECHPAGSEVVVCISGIVTVVRESTGDTDEVVLRPGQATINPAHVWHAVDADGPALILTITPGLGTEHRPR